jgi:hypothetical protein
VAVPFDVDGPEGDGVLYQSGVFSFYGEAEFYIDFVRQFEVTDADGEYDHYEQVHCGVPVSRD